MDEFTVWRPIFQDGITREFLVTLDKAVSQSFNIDSRVKAACAKTNCIVELTPRFIRKRAGSYKEDKHFIVSARGPDDQSIDRCNKLIEAIFPFYSQRKVYDRKKQRKPEMGDAPAEDQVSPWDIFQQLNMTKSSSVDLAQIASNIVYERSQQQSKANRESQVEEKHHRAYRHPREDTSNMAVIEGPSHFPMDGATKGPHLTRPSQWNFFEDEVEETVSEAFRSQASFAENSNSELCPNLSDHEQFMTCLDDSLRRSQYWNLPPPPQKQEVPPLYYRNPLRETERKKAKKTAKWYNAVRDTNANNCLEFEHRRRIYQSIALNFQSAWRNLLTNSNNKDMTISQSKNINNSQSTISSCVTSETMNSSTAGFDQNNKSRFLEEENEKETKKDDPIAKVKKDEIDHLIKENQDREQLVLPENNKIIDRGIKETIQAKTKVVTLQHCPNPLADKTEAKPTYIYRPDPLPKAKETEIDRQIRDFIARRRACAESDQYPNPSAIFQFIPSHDVSFHQRQQRWKRHTAPKNLNFRNAPNLECRERQPTSEYCDQYQPHFTQSMKPTTLPAPEGQQQPASQGQLPVQFPFSTPVQQPPQKGSADQDEVQNQMQKLTAASTQPLQSLDSQLHFQQQVPGSTQQVVPWTQSQFPTSQWYPYIPSTCAICPHGFIQDNSERRANKVRSREYQQSRRRRRRSRHRRRRRSPDNHHHRHNRHRCKRKESPRRTNDTGKEIPLNEMAYPLSKVTDKENRHEDNSKQFEKDEMSKKKSDEKSKEAKELLKKPLQTSEKEALRSDKKEHLILGIKKTLAVKKEEDTSTKKVVLTSNKKKTLAVNKEEDTSTKKVDKTSNKKKTLAVNKEEDTSTMKEADKNDVSRQLKEKKLTAQGKGNISSDSKTDVSSQFKKNVSAKGKKNVIKQDEKDKKKTPKLENTKLGSSSASKVIILSEEKTTSPAKLLPLTKRMSTTKEGRAPITKSETEQSETKRVKNIMTLKKDEPGFKISAAKNDIIEDISEQNQMLDSDPKNEQLTEKRKGEGIETSSDSQEVGHDIFNFKNVKNIDERQSVGSFSSEDSTTDSNKFQELSEEQSQKAESNSSEVTTDSNKKLQMLPQAPIEKEGKKKRALSESDLQKHLGRSITKEITQDSDISTRKFSSVDRPKMTSAPKSIHRTKARSSSTIEEDIMANLRKRPSIASARPSCFWSTTDGKRKSMFDILVTSRLSMMSGRQSMASTVNTKKKTRKSKVGANISNMSITKPSSRQRDTNTGNLGVPERGGKSRLSFNFLRNTTQQKMRQEKNDTVVAKSESPASMEDFFWRIIQRLDNYSPDVTFTSSSSATIQNKEPKKEVSSAEPSESVSVSRRVQMLRRYISRLITFDMSPRLRKKRQNSKKFSSSTNKAVIKD